MIIFLNTSFIPVLIPGQEVIRLGKFFNKFHCRDNLFISLLYANNLKSPPEVTVSKDTSIKNS